MKRLLMLLFLLVLPLAVLATACGDDDDAPSATATTGATATTPPSTTPSPAPASVETAPVLPATVTDVDGETVTVTDVSRVVVLNGDLAEVVYALEMGDNVVGTDISATYPPEAIEKATIGYQRTLSAEGILSLNPTLIIGNDAAGPPEVIDQVRSAGVTTVIIKDIATLDDIEVKIESVAAALGVPKRGQKLWDDTKAEIDAAVASASGATSEPKVAFLYLRGATTQMIGGAGSRADVLIEAAGGIDAGVEANIQGYAPITPEALVTASPDVILVLSAGLESVGGVDGLLAIPGVSQTPAGQNQRVIDLDDQYLLGMGPRTGQALTELIAALHPELS